MKTLKPNNAVHPKLDKGIEVAIYPLCNTLDALYVVCKSRQDLIDGINAVNEEYPHGDIEVQLIDTEYKITGNGCDSVGTLISLVDKYDVCPEIVSVLMNTFSYNSDYHAVLGNGYYYTIHARDEQDAIIEYMEMAEWGIPEDMYWMLDFNKLKRHMEMTNHVFEEYKKGEWLVITHY